MKKKTLTNVLFKVIIVLAIILVSLISFLGIHKRNLNDWENVLPDYNLSKELGEIRTFGFVVDKSTETVEDTSDEEVTGEETAEIELTDETTEESTEEEEATTKEVPVNDPSVLTVDNYKKSKSIIEERLKEFGITDVNVTVNEETGDLAVNAPHNRVTDYTVALVNNTGKLEIVDTETEELIMDKNMIKKATAYYVQSDDSTETTSEDVSYDLGVKLEFTSDGQKKLNEISKKYIETTDENGETTQKTITVRLNGEDKYITYFSPDGNYTYLAVPLYQAVSTEDMEAFNDNYSECVIAQVTINQETLPIVYELSTGTYIEANMGENFILYATIFIAAILVVIAIVIICKFKKNGLMAALIEIGYVAILTLLLRAASVSITLTGLVAILLVSLGNYLLLVMLMKKEKFAEFGRFILNMIPFIITIVVFNFAKDINILSIGTVGFWGLL